MDLRAYYRKLREIEGGITDPFVVVVSQETPDGGKPGVRTEVPRHVASKLIVESRARLATVEETREFLDEAVEAKRVADQLAAANRMQVMVVPANELRAAKTPVRSTKEQS